MSAREGTVMFFKVGEQMVPGAEVYFMHDFDTWMPLCFYVFYIRLEGKNILINTGFPKETERIEKFWLDWDKRSTFRRGLLIDDIMNILKLRYEDIDYVFLTPLVIYSTGNVEKFYKSRIFIYRDGWIDFLAPSKKRGMFSALPYDLVFTKESLCKLLTDMRDNIVLVKDGDKISESIYVEFGGVHHRSSMIIYFKINNKTVAFTDSIFTRRNLELRIPIGILESVDEAYDVFEKLKKADIVIPLFDCGIAGDAMYGEIKI
jgi:glyoxylase-like metal-dependent hydrolase (beta-lactamase superfamily II)